MVVVRVAVLDESYKVNEPYFDNTSYIEWLESFTIDETIDDDRRPSYNMLIRKLWDIPFRPSIGNDDDRAAEGLELRARYNAILAKKAGEGEFVTPDVDAIFGECRVLEMLIALSMRMYDLMQDMGLYNSVSRWFWEIMSNVSFDILDDETWSKRIRCGEFVERIVCGIMDRHGHRGRPGGWFYVNGWESMEIWYQMHAYLSRYFHTDY